MSELLKDKLKHIKNFKSFFEQNLIPTGQHQTGSDRSWGERLKRDP